MRPPFTEIYCFGLLLKARFIKTFLGDTIWTREEGRPANQPQVNLKQEPSAGVALRSASRRIKMAGESKAKREREKEKTAIPANDPNSKNPNAVTPPLTKLFRAPDFHWTIIPINQRYITN